MVSTFHYGVTLDEINLYHLQLVSSSVSINFFECFNDSDCQIVITSNAQFSFNSVIYRHD